MAAKKPTFEEAAKAAYPTLFAAAMVLTANRADAEDAVQETLTRACAAYGSFRGESAPATWMYRILVRVTAKERAGHEAAEVEYDKVPSLNPPPDALAALGEEVAMVLDVLRSLPRRQREIATLFYLEELSYAEIAEALEVSQETVRAALRRARASLRKALGVETHERKVPDEMPG